MRVSRCLPSADSATACSPVVFNYMALRLVLAFGGITAILGFVLLYAGTAAGFWLVLAGFPVAVVGAALYPAAAARDRAEPIHEHPRRAGRKSAT